MIQLTCANCRNTIEVDDAFAGGVCRCQFCGTIQTVPKPGARPSTPGSAHAGPTPSEPKALYQVKSRTGLSSAPSGLEELAEVVHSSGLSSGLAHRAGRNVTTATPAQQKASQKKASLIAFVAGFLVITLLSLIAIFVYFSRDTEPTDPDQTTDGVKQMVAKGPAFFQTELSSDKIIYLIDRGDATATFFPVIKRLTTASVASLGGDRMFSVILWNNGSDVAYPPSGTAYATEDQIDKLRKWFDDVSVGRATSIDSAIKQAASQSPGEIVIVSAKADQLDFTDFASVVLSTIKGKSIKIHSFSLANSSPDDPMKRVALESKGTFTHITRAELAKLNHE